MAKNARRRVTGAMTRRRDEDEDGDALTTTVKSLPIDAALSKKKLRRPTLDWVRTATAADFESEDKMTELFTYGDVEWVDLALSRGLVLDRRCTNAAARCDRRDCLAYLMRQGCELDATECMRSAAMNGHLDFMVFVGEYYVGEVDTVFDVKLLATLYAEAAKYNDVYRLHYLSSKGYLDSYSPDSLYLAAIRRGDLECMKVLHESGCPWDEHVCNLAARNGSIDCLRYVVEHGCELDSYSACECAIENNHLDCLKYLCDHEGACPTEEGGMTLVDIAIAYFTGDLKILDYLRDKGASCDVSSCQLAAELGHVECLQHLREGGCPWDKTACEAAACGGHVDCLMYLHEHGCPWDEKTCLGAVDNHQPEILAYLHENGCPWSYVAYCRAIELGSVDCFKYMHEHGLALGIDEILEVLSRVNAREHGKIVQHAASSTSKVEMGAITSIMATVDEVKESIPTGAYMKIATDLKTLYETCKNNPAD